MARTLKPDELHVCMRMYTCCIYMCTYLDASKKILRPFGLVLLVLCHCQLPLVQLGVLLTSSRYIYKVLNILKMYISIYVCRYVRYMPLGLRHYLLTLKVTNHGRAVLSCHSRDRNYGSVIESVSDGAVVWIQEKVGCFCRLGFGSSDSPT